jgi:hypothetical protein
VPTFPQDYPNAAGIQLAWAIAVEHESQAPIAEIATHLTYEPWHLDYADATRVVAAALRKPDTEGEAP